MLATHQHNTMTVLDTSRPIKHYHTIHLRLLKSWRDGQPNLTHVTESKN